MTKEKNPAWAIAGLRTRTMRARGIVPIHAYALKFKRNRHGEKEKRFE
nr:MAG TPA_asm: hypothetical protein [Caudoviricetes sp.]